MQKLIEKYAVSSGADPRIVQILSGFQAAYQAQTEALKALENQMLALVTDYKHTTNPELVLNDPDTPQPPLDGQAG